MNETDEFLRENRVFLLRQDKFEMRGIFIMIVAGLGISVVMCVVLKNRVFPV